MRDLSNLRRQLRQRLKGPGGGFLPETPTAPAAPAGDSFLAPPPPAAATAAAATAAAATAAEAGSAPEPGGFLPHTDAATPILPAIAPRASDSFLPAPVGNPRPEPSPTRPPQTLAALLPGDEADSAHGRCWQMRQSGAALAADSPALLAAWRAAGGQKQQSHLAKLLRAAPESVVFLDIETCGLRGQPVFLIGLCRLGADDLELEYLLARTYAEEAAILTASVDRLGPEAHVVTFNGSTFDLPYLAQRRLYHRLPPAAVARHLDLLPLSRRQLKGRYPDCRLQTLERELCGRGRPTGDVPGAEIPATYQRWLATGDAGLLAPIVLHNAWDLMTMVALAPRLLGGG